MRKSIIKGVLASVFITTSLSSALAGGILSRSSGAVPGTLDPHKATTMWDGNITQEMWEGLLSVVQDGSVIPALATSYTTSKDGKTWTFKLRDAKWSDGKAITAHDVVFTFQRLFDPKTASARTDSLSVIANAKDVLAGKKPVSDIGVKAIDDKTVEIKLDVARSFFANIIAGNEGYILPKHAIEKHGAKWTRAENIVVSSAFKLNKNNPKEITLDKNPHYWNANNVSLDGVKWLILENMTAATIRWRAGDVHTTEGIPSGQFAKLKKEFGDQVQVGPSAGLYYYAFNNNNPKFKDIRVRKALSLAVDRDIIVNRILANGVKISHKIVAPIVTNYIHTAGVDYEKMSKSERLAEAKKLFKAAGYGPSKPLDIELSYNNSEAHKKVAIAVGGMWKELGVKVKYRNAEAKVHYANLGSGNYEVARAGFGGNFYDGASILRILKAGNQWNMTKFNDATFEKYYDLADKEVDNKKRAEYMLKAEQAALDKHPLVPIYHYVNPQLVSSKVKGWSTKIFAPRSALLSLDN